LDVVFPLNETSSSSGSGAAAAAATEAETPGTTAASSSSVDLEAEASRLRLQDVPEPSLEDKTSSGTHLIIHFEQQGNDQKRV